MWPSPPPPPPLNHSSLKQQYYLFIIVGMALIFIIVLLANVFAVGYCTWLRQLLNSQPSPPRPPPPPPPPIGVVQSWIPAYEYKKEEAEEECAVCLSAFAEGEMVRKFVQCGHTFHVECIDLWFRSNTNCPICRSIVLPSPSDSMEMQSQEAMLPRTTHGFTISDILLLPSLCK